jgi:hypothetical protein
MHPHAEEQQRVHEGSGGEYEVVDEQHGGHGQKDGPSVVSGGFERLFQRSTGESISRML